MATVPPVEAPIAMRVREKFSREVAGAGLVRGFAAFFGAGGQPQLGVELGRGGVIVASRAAGGRKTVVSMAGRGCE
jgi:hypothetical protein